MPKEYVDTLSAKVYWRSSGRKVLAKRKQETLLNILSVPDRVLVNCPDPGIERASLRKVREGMTF
jgi:hypothetical protein